MRIQGASAAGIVAGTTSPVYWVLCLVGGVALVGVVAVRLRTRVAVVTLLATAVVATAVLSAGFAVLNSI